MKDTVSNHRAFSLVEIALALGVASFCLLAVFSLLPVGLQSNKAAIEQTAAIGILSSVSGDLRATPRGTTTSAQYQVQIGTAKTLYIAEDGTWAPTLQQQSRYLLNVTFPTNSTGGRASTFATLRLSWPAAASIINATGSVTSFLALDRN
jgi:uncharacterized protein (TIGR02598 family)